MIKVTDNHVHDSKPLPRLVDNIIKSDNVTVAIGKLFYDGAYEGNNIFRYLKDNGILPCIKVRKNARVLWWDWKKRTFEETCQLYLRKMI
jgi:hypothetical protein